MVNVHSRVLSAGVCVETPALLLPFLDCFADILVVTNLHAFPFFQLNLILLLRFRRSLLITLCMANVSVWHWRVRGDLNPGPPAPQASVLILARPRTHQPRSRPYVAGKIINTLFQLKNLDSLLIDRGLSSPSIYTFQHRSVRSGAWNLVLGC